MFFNDFFSFVRIFIVGVLSYLLVVFILRASGKRTLSKMNSYDFIVNVALGSIMGNILINPDLKLFNGIFAFGLLVFLQYLFSSFSVKWKWFSNLVKSDPTLLYYKGEFIEKKLKHERIPKETLIQAVRSSGKSSLEEVYAIVLETDGTVSVMPFPPETTDENPLLP